MKTLIVIAGILIVFGGECVLAYTPQRRDINVGYELSERLIGRLKADGWNDATYERIIAGLARAKNRAATNKQNSYILELASNVVFDLKKKHENDEYFALLSSFRTTHGATMQTPYDQPSNLKNCFVHYPLVDEYARKTNKPTPLILAMWYIESSCAMSNPANRDGLFQIINNDYEPGLVDRAGLESQLNDFARFMDNKWNWYYSRNPQAPRDLGYKSFTYDALQTFAALYNGIDLDTGIRRYPLLNGNPYYFLANATPDYVARRDGLLVFFLKMTKLETEYFGK